MKMLMLCSSFVIGGLMVLGFAEAERLLRIDKVESESIMTGNLSIVDSKGKTRMFMGISKDESVSSFMMYGADSVKPVIALSTVADGKNASISITNSKGVQRLLIRTESDSNAYIYLYDKLGNVNSGIFNAAGTPVVYARKLILTDTSGAARGSFVLDEKDGFHPQISLFDAKSVLKSRWFYSEKGASGLGFFDKNLKNRGLFGMLASGHSYVLINDSTGKMIYLTPEKK